MMRAGGYVVSGEERSASRRHLLLAEYPTDKLLVGARPVALGLQRTQALGAARAFAHKLHELTCDLAVVDRDIRPAGPAPVVQDGDGLQVAAPTARALFRELRKLGGSLRAQLSDELVGEFQCNGFLDGKDDDAPALTFQEAGKEAPILWEMMYECDEAEDPMAQDWRRFWGFRVPITHWMHINRTDEIRLRHGLFVAVTDNLDFAGREASALRSLLEGQEGEVPSASLTAAFRSLVLAELRDTREEEEASAWLRNAGRDWLKRFLEQFHAEEGEEWKERALVRVFNDPAFRYDLIHFACHCQASETVEFLSCLHISVAGEPVRLDVALLAMKSQRRSIPVGQPGPLVFLNACGTAQQAAAHEPPGFPRMWILNRGALAVLATLCPVPDYFAHEFARHFYRQLFPVGGGRKGVRPCFLAEALLATRRHFLEQYNNPLGLAYVLYATQGARVVPDFVAAGDGT